MADEPGEIPPPKPPEPPGPTRSQPPESTYYTTAPDIPAGKDWYDIFSGLMGEAEPTIKTVAVSDKEKKDEADQRWWLRYSVAAFVLFTLWTELVGIFFLLLWQGRGGYFKLNDWLIGVAVGGVFIQTMWCLHAIAAHLFPEGAEKMKERPKGLKGE